MLMPEIRVTEETLPPDGLARYDADANTVFVYLTPSKQFATAGPGLRGPWTCPLLQNLTNAELSKLRLEMTKDFPSIKALRIIKGGPAGVGLFGVFVDTSYVAPKPKVDLASLTDEQRVLWVACRDQNFAPTDKPDCSMDCKNYHKLEGKAGIDWGVCVEPQSPRIGLLTFRHMGCKHYEVRPQPQEDPPEPPAEVVTATETPQSKRSHHKTKKPTPPAAT
jgi:hypothetical protein